MKLSKGSLGRLRHFQNVGWALRDLAFPHFLFTLVISQLWAPAPFYPTFLSIIESLSANVRQNILTLPLVSFGCVLSQQLLLGDSLFGQELLLGSSTSDTALLPNHFYESQKYFFLLLQGAVI